MGLNAINLKIVRSGRQCMLKPAQIFNELRICTEAYLKQDLFVYLLLIYLVVYAQYVCMAYIYLSIY